MDVSLSELRELVMDREAWRAPNQFFAGYRKLGSSRGVLKREPGILSLQPHHVEGDLGLDEIHCRHLV